MKEILIPVVLVFAALGGLAWWSMKGGSIYSTASPNATVTPPVETKPAPVPQPKRKAKPVATPMPEPVQATVRASEAAPVAISELPATRPLPPFPAVQEIQSGAQEDKIVERYGEPSLSMTVSDHDHILETLIYTRERGQFQTLIRVEDGRVLAAYSQTMPPPMDMPVVNMRVRH